MAAPKHEPWFQALAHIRKFLLFCSLATQGAAHVQAERLPGARRKSGKP